MTTPVEHGPYVTTAGVPPVPAEHRALYEPAWAAGWAMVDQHRDCACDHIALIWRTAYAVAAKLVPDIAEARRAVAEEATAQIDQLAAEAAAASTAWGTKDAAAYTDAARIVRELGGIA